MLTPEVATSSSSGEKATPAAPALTGERRIRTIFFVATFQMTVFGAFPVTASSRPSWLKASETTYPNGPRRFPSAVWSAAVGADMRFQALVSPLAADGRRGKVLKTTQTGELQRASRLQAANELAGWADAYGLGQAADYTDFVFTQSVRSSSVRTWSIHLPSTNASSCQRPTSL